MRNATLLIAVIRFHPKRSHCCNNCAPSRLIIAKNTLITSHASLAFVFPPPPQVHFRFTHIFTNFCSSCIPPGRFLHLWSLVNSSAFVAAATAKRWIASPSGAAVYGNPMGESHGNSHGKMVDFTTKVATGTSSISEKSRTWTSWTSWSSTAWGPGGSGDESFEVQWGKHSKWWWNDLDMIFKIYYHFSRFYILRIFFFEWTIPWDLLGFDFETDFLGSRSIQAGKPILTFDERGGWGFPWSFFWRSIREESIPKLDRSIRSPINRYDKNWHRRRWKGMILLIKMFPNPFSCRKKGISFHDV